MDSWINGIVHILACHTRMEGCFLETKTVMIKSRGLLIIGSVFFPCILLVGCATRQVERVHPNEIIDLSGKWNDSDSRLTVRHMIADCLSQP